MSRSMEVTGSVTPPRHVRVLHVDDDPALRDLAADFLERVDEEMTVRSESDPRAVPERIESEPIHCVVSDKRMPECDGLELCRRVREDHPDLPFVLFTSEGGDDVVERANEVGVTDYVPKAPGVEQYELLADRIRAAVEHRRSRERYDDVETPSGTQPTA
ncbi:MAG: response regulator [Haloarculaceae archaeon]